MAHAGGSVVVLPSAGDAALAAQRDAVRAAVELAVQGQGLRIVQYDTVAHGEQACAQVDCAPALLREARVDLAVAVAVWGDPSGAAGGVQVFVTLVDSEGNRFPGAARAEPGAAATGGPPSGDLAAAGRTALLDARALQLLGPGPWLHVRGGPDGAQVVIDGKVVGALPYRGHLDAGRHEIEVRADGMRTHTQPIDLPPNPGRLTELAITLSPSDGASTQGAAGTPGSSAEDPAGAARAAPAESAADDHDDSHGTSHPIVGPLILGGAGLALGALVIADALADDCARNDSNGVCTKRGTTSAPLEIGIGAGAAAAIGGAVLWYILGAEDADDGAAAMSLRGTSVVGHF